MNIPNVGLGFWQIKKEDAKRVFLDGIKAGYRHIDTAIAYGNESEIGEAIKECGINREELFITSKIPAEIKDYEEAKQAIDESLKRLQLDYLDLMLIHAPKPWKYMFAPTFNRYFNENLEVWKALEEAKQEGKIKEIGVSNFNIKDLENIIKNSSTPIYANQIRVHIGHVNKKLIKFCKEHNIVVEAYSPSGTGRLINNSKVLEIAEKYNVSSAQICNRYCLDLGLITLPRSKNTSHIKENISLDFKIEESDRKKLDKIKTL